jgi:hypothetical protein
LTWVTLSINEPRWLAAQGADPSVPLPSQLVAQLNQAVNGLVGFKTGHWKVALVCGIVAVICATFMIAIASARVVGAAVLLLAGLCGSAIALFAATIDGTRAIDAAANVFVGPGDVKRFFNASVGIGIWICAIGGLVAIAAGITDLMGKSAAPTATVMNAGDDDPTRS